MNTVQLECFLAVAEHLNYARAAETLHITQPAVTHQINSLESELDARLFQRTTRSVNLTDAGVLFMGDARRILNMSNSAKMRLIHKSEQETLPFTVGCHTPAEMRLIPPLIRALRTDFPNLHPILQNGSFPTMAAHLAEGSLDVLFGFRDKNKGSRFAVYNELFKAQAALVVSQEHPLAIRDAVCPEDLLEGNVIMCDPRQNPLAITELQHIIAGSRPASQVYFCENLDCAMALVKSGVGYTLLPYIPQMADDSLCYVPFQGSPSVSFGLYYKSLGHHPALKQFTILSSKLFI